jgi:hypothetical protein
MIRTRIPGSKDFCGEWLKCIHDRNCVVMKQNLPGMFTTEEKRNAMKKIVFAGLLAVCVMAISHQQASAWVNTRFGVGLNWEMQSGGNQFLWGAWRNGQPPGPEAFGGGGGGGGGGGYGAPRFSGPIPQQGFAPAPQGYPAQGFAPMPQGFPPQGFAPQSPFDASTSEPPFAGQYASPYQFANYPRPVYYYYPGTYYGR